MSTDSAETGIDFLFASENAAPSAEQANPHASEQPTPPDVEPFAQPVTEANPQPHEQQPVPGQEQQPAQQQGQQPQQHTVPLSELIDMRKRAQAAEELQRSQQQRLDQMEQMMARFSQPQQPQQQSQQPQFDPMDDPEGYANSIIQAVEQRFLNQQLQQDENSVRTKLGGEFVDEAYEAARKAGMLDRFAGRQNAWTDMVDWYQGRQIKERVGGDLTAYEQNLKEQLRQQVLAEMRQGTPPPSNITPPLSSATRASPQAAGAIGSDNDFFNEMMNRKRG